jgi:hypothetical protein
MIALVLAGWPADPDQRVAVTGMVLLVVVLPLLARVSRARWSWSDPPV